MNEPVMVSECCEPPPSSGYGPYAEPYQHGDSWQWRLNTAGNDFLAAYLREYPVPARLAKKASNSRSAYKTAVRCGMSFDEINSVCYQAVIRAAMKFDPNRKIKFSSYVSWWMRSMLSRAISDQMRAAKNGVTIVGVGSGDQQSNNIFELIAETTDDGSRFDRFWLKDRIDEILRKQLRSDFRIKLFKLKHGLEEQQTEPMSNEDIGRRFNISGEKVRRILNEINSLIEDDLEEVREVWNGRH